MTTITTRLLNPWTDEMETRTFSAVGCGVYDTTDAPGTSGQQMCYRLAGSGDTLSVRRDIDEAGLRRIIAREQRARLASYRREVRQ